MDNDICKHHCTSCMNQARDVLFSCVECEDFNLCFQCYVYGTEIGRHKRDHEVKMIDLGTFPIFKPKENFEQIDIDDCDSNIDNELKNIELDDEAFQKFLNEELGREFTENFVVKGSQQEKNKDYKEYEWRAMDEKALFEALTRVGFGNWKDIANYMNTTLGTNITPNEVEKHYRTYYIDGLIGRLCWTWMFTDSVVRQLSRFPFTIRGHHDKLVSNKDNCCNLFKDIPQAELDSLGYLPKRDDFEREFDNEAETLISNLTLGSESEDDIEKKFKLAQIDIYQRRLINRFRKKLIIRVNELIKLFLEVHKNELFKETLQARRDSNSKIFKDFTEKYPMFMPFVRYLRKKDLNSLFEDVAVEQILKILLKKLILLSCLSTNNLATLKTDEKTKMLKVFSEAINKKIEQSINKKVESSSNSDASKSKLSRSDSIDDSLEDIDDMNEIDIMNVVFADEDPIDRECLNQIFNHETISTLSRLMTEFLQKSDNEEFLKDAMKFFKEQKLINLCSRSDDDVSSPKKKFKADSIENNDNPSSPASSVVTVSSTEIQEPETAVSCNLQNISLSESEKKLCNDLKIEPPLYVQFKTALIKQHKKYPKAARHRLNLETILAKHFFGKEHLETLKQIYNYLVSIGLLSQNPQSSTSNMSTNE